MRVTRQYDGWPPTEPLDATAEAVLDYLDVLAVREPPLPAEEVLARIDEYGVVTATVPLGARAELHLQAGDGWDRVLWTAPAGRVYEWTWREAQSPRDLDALLDGEGAERVFMLAGRTAGRSLERLGPEPRTLRGAGTRVGLMQRLGVPVEAVDRPVV